jgi:hypothetical protein
MSSTTDYLESIANECTHDEKRLEYTPEIAKIIDILGSALNEYQRNPTDEPLATIKQGLRAIGNLCFDCDTNRDAVLEQKGIPVIIQTFQVPLLDITLGCILNVTMENELVQQEFIGQGVFRFLKTHKSEVAIQVVSNLLEAVDAELDCLDYLLDAFSEEMIEPMLLILETISEQEKRQPMLFEKRNGINLATKVMDCIESGLEVHQLCNVLCTCTLNDACLYLVDDDVLLQRLDSWILFELDSARLSKIKRSEGSGLNSPDHQRHDIRMTACLCIGNLARTDSNCAKLTPLIGKSLLRLVEHELDTEKPNLKCVHAALGALRNLSLSQGRVLEEWKTPGIVSRLFDFPDLQSLYTTTISIIKNSSIDLDLVFEGTVQKVCSTVWNLPADIDIGVRTETARFLVSLIKRIHEQKLQEKLDELIDLNAVGLVSQCITGGFLSGELRNMEVDQTKVFPSVQNEVILCLTLCSSSFFSLT